MEAVTAGGRALPRLLLLVSVFLGVLAMHTLGQETHSDHVLPSRTAMHMAAGHVAHAKVPAVTERKKQDPADVMAICLAVLLSIAVLAGPRWRALFAARPAAGLRSIVAAAGGAGSRSPPGLGLALTRVAVIRI